MNQRTIMKAGFLKGTILSVLILVMAFLIGTYFYSIGKKRCSAMMIENQYPESSLNYLRVLYIMKCQGQKLGRQ